MYLNKAIIIGNLTRDPELKALPSGIKVCSFGVATNRTWRDKEGVKQDNTEYHNVVAFAKTGELAAQYLKKGQNVLVEGRIQTRSWDQNGEKKYRTEIIADSVQFGNRPSGAGASSGAQASTTSPASQKTGDTPPDTSGDKIEYPTEEINPEDIPF